VDDKTCDRLSHLFLGVYRVLLFISAGDCYANGCDRLN
jgi:hypothetical protein